MWKAIISLWTGLEKYAYEISQWRKAKEAAVKIRQYFFLVWLLLALLSLLFFAILTSEIESSKTSQNFCIMLHWTFLQGAKEQNYNCISHYLMAHEGCIYLCTMVWLPLTWNNLDRKVQLASLMGKQHFENNFQVSPISLPRLVSQVF